MTFVNEFASKEDLEKYGITELQKTHHVPSGWDEWTIDRERNIVLMLVGQGSKEGPDNGMSFLLLRNGDAQFYDLTLETDLEKKVLRWSIRRWRGQEPKYANDEERRYYEVLHEDLKDALRAYKGSGPYPSRYNEFENEFTNF